MSWLKRILKGEEPKGTGERFSLQNGVSEILSRTAVFDDAIDELLATIASSLKWDYGALWMKEPGSERLEPFRIWHIEDERLLKFAELTRTTSFETGVGLPGRVLLSGVPHWIEDVDADPNYTRGAAAREAAIRTSMAFPLVVRGSTAGVLEFACRSQRRSDQAILDLLNSVGHQIGQFIALRRLEIELSGTEMSFQVLVESMSDAVVTMDEESRIRFANPAAEQIFGHPREDLLRKRLTELMPEEMRAAHEKGLERYLRTGERRLNWRHLELPGLHSSGARLDLSVSFGEASWREGRLFIGILRDVSDQKRAQQEKDRLRDQIVVQERRLREVVSQVPGVVWEAWGQPDEASQKINFVSDHVEEMLGYTVEEWLSEPNFWLKIVHPDDREQAARTAAQSFRQGSGRNSFRWIRRDGRAIWCEAQSVTIYEDGEPVGMRGVTMDVSERIRTHERNELLAHAGAAFTRSLDPEETLAEIARQVVPPLADWCAVDLVEGDTIRRVAVQHVDPEKVDFAKRLQSQYPVGMDDPHGVAKVIREGKPELVSDIPPELLEGAARDAEHLRIIQGLGLESYMIVPMIARNRVIGTITFVAAESGRHYDESDLVFADMLVRRAALAVDNARLYREAQLANQAKDEFLATLSHELRTPMTSILGWARMLQIDGVASDVQEEAIETISRAAEAQSQIIDDVLDVSRIVTGKMALELEPVDLNRIITQALQTVRPAAAAKSIEIRTELEPVPETLADPARIQQVLWNLVSNAIKFTPRRGTIGIRSRLSDSSIVVEVEDSGVGMDPEFLASAFERFRQAEGSTSRRFGGLGLGLSIVKHLIELHGGEVRAFSEGKDQGSLFVLEIPVAAVRVEVSPNRRSIRTGRGDAGMEGLPDLDGSSILVVDDEKDARRLVTAVLEQCGAEVRSAASVREALELLDQRPPDVIISDIGMPDQDGFSLIRTLRDGGVSLPVIALTAYGRDEDRKAILEAGFDRYLRKPVQPSELGLAVLRVLRSPSAR